MFDYLFQLLKNKVTQNSTLPLELIIYVTELCNLSCRHCFVNTEKARYEKELTLEEFEKLSSSIPRLVSLMLTGGEPFLRDDLSETVKLFDRNSKPIAISMITNGSLTEKIENTLNKLKESNIKANLILSISIDGDAQTHNKIRGKDNVYSSIKNTVKMIKNHSLRSQLLLGINITFCEENQDTPYEIYKKLIKEEDMNFGSVNLIRGDTVGKYKKVDIHKYIYLSRMINKYNKIQIKKMPKIIKWLHSIKENYQGYLIKKVYTDRRYQGIICEAGRNIGVIDSIGNVYPCELLKKKFGSIRKESFPAIWNKPENVLFAQKAIREEGCFCHHECFLSASINLNILNQIRSLYWHIFLSKER